MHFHSKGQRGKVSRERTGMSTERVVLFTRKQSYFPAGLSRYLETGGECVSSYIFLLPIFSAFFQAYSGIRSCFSQDTYSCHSFSISVYTIKGAACKGHPSAVFQPGSVFHRPLDFVPSAETYSALRYAVCQAALPDPGFPHVTPV